MKVNSLVFFFILFFVVTFTLGCQREESSGADAGGPIGTTPAPSVKSVDWDSPDKVSEVEWPVAGVAPSESTDVAAFGRGSGNAGVLKIWRRLATYGGTYLKSWRDLLDASAPPPANELVDAFNELALAVTGPTGFWRKTLPARWLGCETETHSEPCRKLGELQPDLAQWDNVQKEIEQLAPERAAHFLARNEARILAYLDMYVPAEPNAEAMAKTPFYQKHLAKVMGARFGSGSANQDDL